MKLKPFKVDTLGRNVKLLEVMNKFDHQFRLHSLDLNEEYSFFSICCLLCQGDTQSNWVTYMFGGVRERIPGGMTLLL